ncbi:hypothetical protein [Laceyella putida]|uniref:C1q domain-containing protein n=1 Tax=Laceyella putida TaxID=110101 RepID=A0ABW2RQW7_9BACL
MAKTFYPFDTIPVMEAEWSKMAQWWRTNGVLVEGQIMDSTSADLAVTKGTDPQVKVAKGKAWIEGHYFESTATETLTPPSNQGASGNRVDRVTLELDWVKNKIDLVILPGGTDGQPPTLPNSSAKYYIPLAKVTISNTNTIVSIEDEREPSIGPGFTIAAKVGRSAAQTITSGLETSVLFTVKHYDNCNIWNGGYKLTAPKTGLYLATLCINWQTNTNGSRIHRIRKNGSTVIQEEQFPSGSASFTRTITTVTRLSKGDYIEALVLQNSGVNLDIGVLGESQPSLSLTFLSE